MKHSLFDSSGGLEKKSLIGYIPSSSYEKCPKCQSDKLKFEYFDDIGILCGREGVETICLDCGWRTFEGKMA